jgi:cytochrome c553
MRTRSWVLVGLAILGGMVLRAEAAAPEAGAAVSLEKRVAACTACHKQEDQVTRDGVFPRIAGKPAGYLYNQLLNFRDGRRQYPPMTWMVSQLSDDYLREIAEHFSQIHAPYPPPPALSVPPSVLERGRQLALKGDAGRQLPACAACHGERLTGATPSIPALIGLPRDYLNAQFGAWRTGSRHAAAPDCMAGLSEKMSNEDVLAVTAWLALQPVPAQAQPQAGIKLPLPLACGSVPGSGK